MKILALDIGGTALKVAKTTIHGEILESAEYPSHGKLGGDHIMKTICEIIEQTSDYDLIGISTCGQVDIKTGSIVFANDNVPNYTGMQIKKILEEKFKVPVQVENDVNAAALGEAYYGAGRAYEDFLCLTYGTGIGGAIIINRHIYGGSKGVAGEFGHILTHPDGLECTCGQCGCYEQYASTTALVREAMKIDSKYENGRMIFEEFHRGDVPIKQVIDQWIDELILGLISLVHVFNPNCLILGGGVLGQNYIIEEINNRLFAKLMPSYRDVVIKKAELGNNAGVLGATQIALTKYK